jgi:hypothetical protein
LLISIVAVRPHLALFHPNPDAVSMPQTNPCPLFLSVADAIALHRLTIPSARLTMLLHCLTMPFARLTIRLHGVTMLLHAMTMPSSCGAIALYPIALSHADLAISGLASKTLILLQNWRFPAGLPANLAWHGATPVTKPKRERKPVWQTKPAD